MTSDRICYFRKRSFGIGHRLVDGIQRNEFTFSLNLHWQLNNSSYFVLASNYNGLLICGDFNLTDVDWRDYPANTTETRGNTWSVFLTMTCNMLSTSQLLLLEYLI